MDRVLLTFIREHKEYFEGHEDARFIRRDLRRLLDEYAQSIDPEEYAELRRRVDAFRESEKERLQNEVDALMKKRASQKQELDAILGDMRSMQKELERLDHEFRKLDQEKSTAPVERAWYHSGYLYLLLDFLGVAFLYTGIILNEKLTMSYVLLGLASVGAGFLLQSGGKNPQVEKSDSFDGLRQAIQRRRKEFENISRIKRMALRNRKKVALDRIRDLDKEIEVSITQMNEFLRE